MIQSKNLKLKLGLCGLALTSFLAINTHDNTVHADTVSGNNANAITWDSDSDDSQVVKNEAQQSHSSQSAQIKNAPAVQSNVQEKKQIAVSSVSSTPAVQKRAEMGIVRQSNAQTSTVNRLNANVARNNQVKVANVHATENVKITNPNNNQVVVHYVKSNGQSIDDHNVKDQTIDTTKDGKGNYTVPAGYTLANNGYTVTHTAPDPQSIYTWTFRTGDAGPNEIPATSDAKLPVEDPNSGLWNTPGETYKTFTVPQETIDELNNVLKTHYNTQVEPGDFIEFPMETDVSDDAGKHSYYIDYAVYHKYSDNDEWYSDSKTSPFDGVFYFKGTESDIIGDHTINKWDPSLTRISVGSLDSNLKSYILHTAKRMKIHDQWWNRIMIGDPSKSIIFQDNSGQVKSVVGNHINVQVTRPSNVDPNSAQCKKQATRVIHIAFPNGVKPESYDSITDSAGNKLTLDSNNNLTQTVTFTRSVTVDSLTGATLNQTPWKQHGAINAVTLPDIPGYTMTQS